MRPFYLHIKSKENSRKEQAMKKHIFILAVAMTILVTATSGQTGPYTVVIRFDSITSRGNEWDVELYADVFDGNRNLIPFSVARTYYYRWYYDTTCSGNNWRLAPYLDPEVAGNTQIGPDGHWVKQPQDPDCCPTCAYESWLVKVVVSIDDHDVTSQVVRVPDNGTGNVEPRQRVVVDQQTEGFTSIGNIGRKYSTGIFNYPAPFTFYNVAGQTEVFKGSQDLFSGPYQKYNRWSTASGDLSDVVNHRSFTIGSGQQQYTSRLKAANNPTIQTCTTDGIFSGAVYFKDPWLVDDYSDPLGPRNRGNNALFYSKSTPFYPLNDASTKGVFLGQEIAPGLPYYTVRAYDIVEGTRLLWSFGYWTATNASLADPNNIESAVVFNSANATVTANYTTVIKPLPPANVTAGGPFGSYVRVTWDEHPSPNVTQYRIIRKVKHIMQGYWGSPQLLATVNRGTTSYTDGSYQLLCVKLSQSLQPLDNDQI
jgi:hypothetical protein